VLPSYPQRGENVKQILGKYSIIASRRVFWSV
jgi:hypothetical protein